MTLYDFGIFTWYLKNYTDNELDYLSHSVKGKMNIYINNINIRFKNSQFSSPISLKALMIFFYKSVLMILNSFIKLLVGKWWFALLSKEILLSYVVEINKDKGLGKHYLFNNSSSIYRPIWTYSAEKFGAKISFYFYSTNNERFKQKNTYPKVANFWHLTTWPEYLVWDIFQKNFIDTAIGSIDKTLIVGPIYFQCSNKSIELPTNTFAVFDVQPVRHSFYVILGLDQEYYIPKIANQFLNDITEVLNSTKYKIAIKKKREIGKLAHLSYINNFKRLINNNNIINIDSDIPAESFIKDTKGVISMPFTSTAIIAHKLGKPSIYYDPSGLIEKDDRAAHGIPIINNKSELLNWINSFSTN